MRKTLYWLLTGLATIVGYMLASRSMENKRDFR